MAIEDEKELVEIFNDFWVNHASKDANVDNWKGYPNGSKVVGFLQNEKPKTKKLMESFGYRKTKNAWDNAHEKNKNGEESEDKEFELNEEQVVWGRITNVVGGPLGYGINFYVEIRNWPIEWLSESNKHTRQYVLNNIDKGKGLATIIDTARKKVGEQEEAAEKKKKEKSEPQTEETQSQTSEEPAEDNVVGKVGYVKESDVAGNPVYGRMAQKGATPGAEYVEPDKAGQTTESSETKGNKRGFIATANEKLDGVINAVFGQE